MDRYAVINEKNTVVNVIAWDGIAKWTPPEGHRLEQHEDVGIGDVWIEELKQFVRPLSNLKAPEDEISISERRSAYEEAKNKLKSSMLFIDHTGKLEA
jgi:hypothetical protein